MRTFFNYLLATLFLGTTLSAQIPAQLLKDINPGDGSSIPSQIFQVGGKNLFFAEHPDLGYELFETDGTEAGTQLIKDINPGDSGAGLASHRQFGFVENGGMMYFYATSGLWRTDGTATGTIQLMDLETNLKISNYSFMAALGDDVFVLDLDEQLLKTNGTVAGFEDIAVVPELSRNLVSANGKLYFLANEYTGTQPNFFVKTYLWESDGTASGTQQLELVMESYVDHPTSIKDAGGRLFSVNDQLIYAELTCGNCPPSTNYIRYHETRANPWDENWAFLGDDLLIAPGTVLERVNANGRDTIKNLNNFYGEDFTVLGNKLYFDVEQDLWVSDGTETGTVKVKDEGWVSCSNYWGGHFAQKDDKVFFSLCKGNSEIWVTDGTAAGTQLAGTLPDFFFSSSGGQIFNLSVVEEQLFFTFQDSLTGHEMWVLDVSDFFAPPDCGGDKSITNQQGLNAIAGCKVIDGDLAFGGSVSDLSLLTHLEEVTGDLRFYQAHDVTELNGLENLKKVGGVLQFIVNDGLENVDGLSSLEQVGSLHFGGTHDALKNIDGLSNLTQVDSFIAFNGPNDLEHLNGLANVQGKLKGGISIVSIDRLKNVDGLAGITGLGEGLYIWGQ